MTEIVRRRRAWQALGLGPLWLPVQGRLPGAPPMTADEGSQDAGELSRPACLDGHPIVRAATPEPGEHDPALPSAVTDAPSAIRSAPGSDEILPEVSGSTFDVRFDVSRGVTSAAPHEDARSRAADRSAAPAGSGRADDGPAPRLAESLGRALGMPMQPDTRPIASPSVAEDQVPQAKTHVPTTPADDWLEPWTVDDGWVEATPLPLEEPPGLWDEAGQGPPGEASALPGSPSSPAPAGPSGPATDPTAPSMPQRWQALREAVADCQRCRLAETRQNVVFGRGRPDQARWLLIGEAPGAEEDRQGEAFVGQAGRLLDAMLQAAGIDPDADVFIANVLKCRPPGNRNPEADEVARCEGFLHEQIRLSRPDCILLLGRFAAQSVLQSELPIGRLRNRLHHITLDGRRIPVVVTYHPAYLLRNQADKLKSWEDLCLALSAIEEGTDPPRPLASRPGH